MSLTGRRLWAEIAVSVGPPSESAPAWRFRLAIPFLLALPHFGFLLMVFYPVPLASALVLLELLLVLAFETQRGFLRLRRGAGVSGCVGLFWLYCLGSAVFGYLSLQGSGRDVLHLTEGDVSYLSASTGRLVQLTLAFAAFEFVRRTHHRMRELLGAWLLGLAIATVIHAIGWAFSPDLLASRAGTFPEGNQAGLYYLLSLFVALEYGWLTRRRMAIAFAACAVLGLLMSRSTAGLVALAIALGLRACLNARGLRQRSIRTVQVIAVFALGAGLIQTTSLGDELVDKLFEQDVTSTSLSRIDRLASAEIGIELFFEAPVFGHGIQSYGFLSNERLEGPLADVYDWSLRRIVNNIYVEVACELGLVGLTLLALLLHGVWREASRTGRDPNLNFRCGIVGVLVYWLAFPTYSVIFVWAFLGLATHDVVRRRGERRAASLRQREAA